MSKKNTSKDILVQGSILAAASIIVRIIGLLYRVPMNNILGESGVGLYGLSFEIYNLGLILSSYSLPLAVSKMVSAKIVKNEYKNVKKIMICSLAFALISGTLMSGILFFGSDLIATYIFATPAMAYPLRALSPTILVFSIMGVLRGLFQGQGTMIPTSISQVIEQIIHAVVSIALPAYIMYKFSTSPMVTAYAAAGGTAGTFVGALASFVFLIVVYVFYRPVFQQKIEQDPCEQTDSYKTIFRVMIMTIVPVILSQTVYQISGTLDGAQFSHIMAAKGVLPDKVQSLYGIYSGYYRLLTNVPVAIASALGTSAIPTIVASRVMKDHKAVQHQIYSTIKFNMLIAIPSFMGMTVLARPILAILFPSAGDLAVKCLTIGSVAVVFFSLSTVSSAILQGIDLMKLSVVNSAISLAIHVVFLYIMLRFMNLGVTGLVIGNVTFALVVCILNWRSIGKALGYRQEVKTTFVLPFICSVIMGIGCKFMYVAVAYITHSTIISFLFALVIALFIYGTMLLVFHAVTEEELKTMPLGTKLHRVLVKLNVF